MSQYIYFIQLTCSTRAILTSAKKKSFHFVLKLWLFYRKGEKNISLSPSYLGPAIVFNINASLARPSRFLWQFFTTQLHLLVFIWSFFHLKTSTAWNTAKKCYKAGLFKACEDNLAIFNMKNFPLPVSKVFILCSRKTVSKRWDHLHLEIKIFIFSHPNFE